MLRVSKTMRGQLFFSIFCMAVFTAFPLVAQDGDDASDIPTSQIIYEKPSVQTFSQLYWAIGRLDLENEKHVDNFMRINECDIYKDYINHEFEWTDIRESAKTYIQANKKDFPLRFEFTQKIKLTDYDLEKQAFDIFNEHQIKGIKRFFMPAENEALPICGTSKDMTGYPRKLLVELSKPFTLEDIPMEKERANTFITKRLQRIKSLPKHQQAKVDIHDSRYVILVMNVKLFANQGARYIRDEGAVAHVLGVLESFQVYADKERDDLLMERDFRNRRQEISEEQRLKLLEEEHMILEQAATRRKAKEDAEAMEKEDKKS